jgi:hypothetical protein
MRIGTWNLAGRWDSRHERLMNQQNCDVWLLTEVSERLTLHGYNQHSTVASMAQRRRWAAILSREELVGLPDPHPASALGRIGNLQFCCSILPWRSCGSQLPWVGTRHADKTQATLAELLKVLLPANGLVWGGDWNHALTGDEFSGSKGGRAHILNAVTALRLQVPTSDLPHRLPDCLSIDHIAIPQAATFTTAKRVDASDAGIRLSDHDAYVLELL